MFDLFILSTVMFALVMVKGCQRKNRSFKNLSGDSRWRCISRGVPRILIKKHLSAEFYKNLRVIWAPPVLGASRPLLTSEPHFKARDAPLIPFCYSSAGASRQPGRN